MLIRVSFLYNKVELNILLSHVKDLSFLEKLLFATIIKTKIAKNKATRETKVANLLKINKIATTKEIVNLHKFKDRKYINKNKEKCYSNNNKHFKFDLKIINN